MTGYPAWYVSPEDDTDGRSGRQEGDTLTLEECEWCGEVDYAELHQADCYEYVLCTATSD